MDGRRLVAVAVKRSRLVMPSAFTASECEVAKLAMLGLSNLEIGKRRRCSSRTVANHLANIFQKLGIHCRPELAARLASGLEALESSSPSEEAVRCWDDLVEGRREILKRTQDEEELTWILGEAGPPGARPLLRPIERRVLDARGRGHSNKDIAYALGRSQATVSGIARKALRHLGLREVWAFSAMFGDRSESGVRSVNDGGARPVERSALGAAAQ